MLRFGDENGFYEFNSFPGCNQIIVSNHAFVYPDKRGNGKGTEYNLIRIEKAKILGFDYLMCTVVASNKPQLRIMEKNGFKELDEFRNKETGNLVKIFGRKLND